MDVDVKAARIVEDILNDLKDRRGLRQAWESIDLEARCSVAATWITLVRKRLEEAES